MSPRGKTRWDRLGHFVAVRKKRSRPKPRWQPPLTPMIDVTFQLLLFFILAAQFGQAEGQIPGTLPQGQSPSPATAEEIYRPVHIRVRPPQDDEQAPLYRISEIAGRIETAEELYRKLAAYRRQVGSDRVPVVIEPVGSVPWRYIVEAYNAVLRAGFARVGFARGQQMGGGS